MVKPLTEEMHYFHTRADAWNFVRTCRANGLEVGYPEWVAGDINRSVRYTVCVKRPTGDSGDDV